jgi:hypothetical protein
LPAQAFFVPAGKASANSADRVIAGSAAADAESGDGRHRLPGELRDNLLPLSGAYRILPLKAGKQLKAGNSSSRETAQGGKQLKAGSSR